MKRSIVAAILILVCFILQCTIFRAIDFGGIVPNLLIILTSSFGFMRGERTGLMIGFFCGILSDIFFGDVLGFYALILMYIGYMNGKFSRIFYPEDIKLPAALIIASDFCYGVICYVLMRGRIRFCGLNVLACQKRSVVWLSLSSGVMASVSFIWLPVQDVCRACPLSTGN